MPPPKLSSQFQAANERPRYIPLPGRETILIAGGNDWPLPRRCDFPPFPFAPKAEWKALLFLFPVREKTAPRHQNFSALHQTSLQRKIPEVSPVEAWTVFLRRSLADVHLLLYHFPRQQGREIK